MTRSGGGGMDRHRAPGAIPQEGERCPATFFIEAQFVHRRDCPVDCLSETTRFAFAARRKRISAAVRRRATTC